MAIQKIRKMRLINILLKANPIGIIIALISAIGSAASSNMRVEDEKEYHYNRDRNNVKDEEQEIKKVIERIEAIEGNYAGSCMITHGYDK